jgi:hypothetical protein
VIDRPLAHHLVGDQGVLLVQEQDAKLLARRAGQRQPDVREERRPA